MQTTIVVFGTGKCDPSLIHIWVELFRRINWPNCCWPLARSIADSRRFGDATKCRIAGECRKWLRHNVPAYLLPDMRHRRQYNQGVYQLVRNAASQLRGTQRYRAHSSDFFVSFVKSSELGSIYCYAGQANTGEFSLLFTPSELNRIFLPNLVPAKLHFWVFSFTSMW